MTPLLIILGAAAALIALILILPCPACLRRRERLRAAYAEWRRIHGKTEH